MVLFVLVYLGGVLTIVSPCILPVLPFVFARADRPFARSGLPLLVGMAATFAAVATLAAVGGGWAVHANQYGRVVAIALLALFGLALLIGGRVLAALKQSLEVGEWIRRGLGVAVLVAVAAIALGLDTGFLTRVSLARTASLEQRLLDTFHAAPDAAGLSPPSVVMTG